MSSADGLSCKRNVQLRQRLYQLVVPTSRIVLTELNNEEYNMMFWQYVYYVGLVAYIRYVTIDALKYQALHKI